MLLFLGSEGTTSHVTWLFSLLSRPTHPNKRLLEGIIQASFLGGNPFLETAYITEMIVCVFVQV